MKRYVRILFAIAFILGLSGAAKAENKDGVEVTLPFKFVIGGKTLPAGTYTVRNASNDLSGPLMITNRDKKERVFVLPYVSESASTTGKPELSFQRGGEGYFLSSIRTSWYIYRFPVSQSALTEAVAVSGNNAPASGGSE